MYTHSIINQKRISFVSKTQNTNLLKGGVESPSGGVGWGWAINFYSSDFSLRRIYACRCSCGTSYGGLFGHRIGLNMNQVEYLSISYCSDSGSGYCTIYLLSGHQRVDRTNSSMNKAVRYPIIFFYLPTTLSSSFCTYKNNKILESRCIYIYW